MVITVFNGKQPEKDCWYAKRSGLWYLKGDRKVKDSGGCYLMQNNRYASQKYVIWSDILGEYVKKRDAIEVIVDTDLNTDYVLDLHGFTNEIWYKGRMFQVSDKVNLEYFNFDTYTGQFYVDGLAELKGTYPKASNKKEYTGYPEVYNYSDLPHEIKQQTIRGAREEKESFKFDEELAEGFNNLTFGVELETSRNLLPQKYLNQFGFVPVRDGSIDGNELISIPFQGVNGLRNLYHFAQKFKKYTEVNHKCSYHVHQGNINVKDEKSFIVALHWLYYLLQNELYELVPSYKTDFKVLARNDRGRGKDYCKPIPSLNARGKSVEERYDSIFHWCNDFNPKDEYCNPDTRKHCKGEVNKWNLVSRYYQLNLYNRFFSDSNTIEYRLHHGTNDPEDIICWLALTMSITNYAIEHSDRIINEKFKYDLDDMIKNSYNKELANYINAWIRKKKDFFNAQKMMQDNGMSSTFKKKKPSTRSTEEVMEIFRQVRQRYTVD